MQFILLLTILSTIEIIHGFCGDDGCIFNGAAYAPFIPVQFGCFVFECIKYDKSAIPIRDAWQFLYINGSCATCSTRVDPHFRTFDNHRYDFHGKCNYTISQPIDDCRSTKSSYYPPYGIFGDFRFCIDGFLSPTCLDLTTYKISNDISVLIRHTSNPIVVEINGTPLSVTSVPISYYDCSYSLDGSVIVWKSGSCVFIVGTHYSILACNNYIIVYTVPEQKNKIAGLCGFYTGVIPNDEFRLRDCTYELLTNPTPFGENWRTIDQNERDCIGKYVDPGVQVIDCDKEEAQKFCESVIAGARRKCPYGYSDEEFKSVIEDCVEDCCLAGIGNCEIFAAAGVEYLCSLYDLYQVTKGEGKGK